MDLDLKYAVLRSFSEDKKRRLIFSWETYREEHSLPWDWAKRHYWRALKLSKPDDPSRKELWAGALFATETVDSSGGEVLVMLATILVGFIVIGFNIVAFALALLFGFTMLFVNLVLLVTYIFLRFRLLN